MVQRELVNDGYEGVLRIPQSSSITGASPCNCLVSYTGHSLVGSYPLYKEAVGVFYSPSWLSKGLLLLSSLNHIEDIHCLVTEFIFPFNIKTNNWINFNYEFYQRLQFITVLVNRHLWSTSILTWWLKLVILFDADDQFSMLQTKGSLSLKEFLKSSVPYAAGYRLSLGPLIMVNSIQRIPFYKVSLEDQLK